MLGKKRYVWKGFLAYIIFPYFWLYIIDDGVLNLNTHIYNYNLIYINRKHVCYITVYDLHFPFERNLNSTYSFRSLSLHETVNYKG